MKRVLIILVVFTILLATACEAKVSRLPVITTTTTAKATTTTTAARKNLTPQERAELMARITEDNKRLLQATTQIALERNGIADNTSSQLANWTFAVQTLNTTNFWITTTQDAKHGRVKSIFTWSGFESDDMKLVYLLVGGTEVVDSLKTAQDKAWE